MIIYQHRIYRVDLRKNPDVYYIFGDNMERVGYGGQAKEMRDEPNAVGVATKVSPSVFMSDKDLYRNAETFWYDLQPAFYKIIAGQTVVIPSDGIGTGLSDMPNQCPISFKHIEGMLGWMRQVDKTPIAYREDVFEEFEKKFKNYIDGKIQ